jgi:hypothetical protein
LIHELREFHELFLGIAFLYNIEISGSFFLVAFWGAVAFVARVSKPAQKSAKPILEI